MTLFFSVAITAILFGVSGMMYKELVHQLHEKEEMELMNNLKIQQEILSNLERKKSPVLWQQEWAEHNEKGKKFSWRVLSASGEILAASPNLAAPASAFPPAVAVRPRKFKRWETRSPDRTQYSLLTSMQAENTPGSNWVVQGALDVSQDQKIIDQYWLTLLSALLIAILMSGGVGWFLARQGLAPVRAISSAIGRINAEKLHSRIANEAWPSDLKVLAQAFDEMLGRLESSFEQLSRFSSDLAHEFRSPINNLVAAASVTLTRARNASEYQDTLAVIVEEGGRLSRMVSSMLFLARADNAKQWVHPELLSTATEFQKVLDFFDAVAEEHCVKLTAVGDFKIRADQILIRRALSNLIANALRHTPPNGQIRLVAKDNGTDIALSVTDTGAGIAPEHLPFLFDRFYRTDTARSSSESTGLGLAVVRSIMDLHGGVVTVESTLGYGSCFTLVFPKAVRQHAHPGDAVEV
jgi:two-component system heavy metal sensor histidine kinase CusS